MSNEASLTIPKPSALVADDVVAMQMSLRLALEDAGYEVTCVGGGRDALNTLRAGDFELAILDLWMPDGDGLTVLKTIRKEQPDLRIFVITGGGPRMPLEAAALIANVWGAERVIIKPFADHELIDAINLPRPRGADRSP